MEANGWQFSSSDQYTFLTDGSNDRDTYCDGVSGSSYCGFVPNDELVISMTMSGAGLVEIDYGNSWSFDNSQYVRILLNNVEQDRITNIGRKKLTMQVQKNDNVSISEHNECVISINSFDFIPSKLSCHFENDILTFSTLKNTF